MFLVRCVGSVRWLGFTVVAVALWAFAGPAVGQEEGQLEPIVLPVRVHLLESHVAPDLNSTWIEGDVIALFEEVNEIWGQAAIVWDVESIVRDSAINESALIEFSRGGGGPPDRPTMVRVCPTAQWFDGGWNVCIIRQFTVPAGGVYIPETGAVLFAELDPRGEMHPRVLAHEFGHSLGLPHNTFQADNLMRSGAASSGEQPGEWDDGGFIQAKSAAGHDRVSEATALTSPQIERARAHARSGAPYRPIKRK